MSEATLQVDITSLEGSGILTVPRSNPCGEPAASEARTHTHCFKISRRLAVGTASLDALKTWI